MKIGEVSKRYNISEDTLRYYERVGVLPPVARDAGGRRNYSAQDLYWVEVAQCMRSVGLSVETVADYVRREQSGCVSFRDRIELFEEQRRELLAQREQLDALLLLLEEKIQRHKEKMEQDGR